MNLVICASVREADVIRHGEDHDPAVDLLLSVEQVMRGNLRGRRDVYSVVATEMAQTTARFSIAVREAEAMAAWCRRAR